MATGQFANSISFLVLSLNENFCAFGFEPETCFRQASLPHCATKMSFIFSVKNEKAASTRAD
jgi:hypothetical protein